MENLKLEGIKVKFYIQTQNYRRNFKEFLGKLKIAKLQQLLIKSNF